MTCSITGSVSLTCHPQTRTDAVRGVTVRVRRELEGLLHVSFALDADLDRLRIPRPRRSRQADELWQHTCFEVFVALHDTPAYHEFNFAPSGEFATHAFRGYRDQASLADPIPAPDISVRRSKDRLDLDAVTHLQNLSATHVHALLRLALSAVIEEASGRLTYWALRHPPGEPDFHHPEVFVLTVETPDA